ncbi:MAG: hypothetical protein J6T87_09205 [Bacteroidales bacterium]|nr:hypothetical protein [Bacteroidales bacterium]
MKKIRLPSLLLLLCCSFSVKCEAQVSLDFKILGVNNLYSWTNHRTDPEMLLQYQYPGMLMSGISVDITAELTNTSDAVLYFNNEVRDDADNVRLAMYFYEMGSGWKKMYLYNPASHDFNVMPGVGSLASGESIALRAAATFPAKLFVKETPLYYMSSIVPTLYLVLEIPGQVPVFSALPENVLLNGVKLNPAKSKCYSCGEIYLLTHNSESIDELMNWVPVGRTSLTGLFGDVYKSYYMLEKAFVCNMDYARRSLPIYTHP